MCVIFKSYYAPNNAVLAVVGNVNPEEVKKMIEKHFGSIPTANVPTKPNVSEPGQTKEKRLAQTDKLANLPALAIGYHLPDQKSPDFAPMVILNLILQGDDSSRLFQRLVKEKEMTPSNSSAPVHEPQSNRLRRAQLLLLRSSHHREYHKP